MILADTDVVSELMRDAPDESVLAWAQSLDVAAVSICVVTVEEIERGLGRVPAGRRRRRFDERWASVLASYADTILTFDVPAAHETGRLLVRADAAGRPMALADAQIAGICLAGGLELDTRNVKDFATVRSLRLVNPFG